jgi:NAD(P)-dependent dehydrogenase (short-subunit alcohol dehydrogenase family)
VWTAGTAEEECVELDGKVAVITGAARGVGKMIVGSLLDAGAIVYLGSRSQDDAEAAAAAFAARGDCRPLHGVITDDDACRQMAAKVASEVDAVHLLVNNAATNATAPMHEVDLEAWDATFDVNVKAPFLMTRAFLPLLTAQAAPGSTSRVVNISSISGVMIDGLPSYAYSASKAALNQLTRMLALELAPQHVTVNALALGPFETEKMKERGDISPHIAVTKLRNPLTSPQRRTGLPEEVGGTVVFLAGPSGGYITGAILPVDGGIATTR